MLCGLNRYAISVIVIFIFFSVLPEVSSLVFSPPETKDPNHIRVEFHCLLFVAQWGFDDSSNVYIRFVAPQLGGFDYCYGPMQKIIRFVNYFC